MTHAAQCVQGTSSPSRASASTCKVGAGASRGCCTVKLHSSQCVTSEFPATVTCVQGPKQTKSATGGSPKRAALAASASAGPARSAAGEGTASPGSWCGSLPASPRLIFLSRGRRQWPHEASPRPAAARQPSAGLPPPRLRGDRLRDGLGQARGPPAAPGRLPPSAGGSLAAALPEPQPRRAPGSPAPAPAPTPALTCASSTARGPSSWTPSCGRTSPSRTSGQSSQARARATGGAGRRLGRQCTGSRGAWFRARRNQSQSRSRGLRERRAGGGEPGRRPGPGGGGGAGGAHPGRRHRGGVPRSPPRSLRLGHRGPAPPPQSELRHRSLRRSPHISCAAVPPLPGHLRRGRAAPPADRAQRPQRPRGPRHLPPPGARATPLFLHST